MEEYVYAVDPRTGCRFYKLAQGNLSLSSPSSSSTIGTATSGRREVGIPGILHGLTVRVFFLNFKTSFGWPGDKLPNNRRRVWTEHPLTRHHFSTYSSSAVSAHMHIHSPREHAWLKGAQPRIACIGVLEWLSSQRPVSSLAALVTEHIYTMSLANPIFRPSPSLSCLLELDPNTLRDSRRSGGSTEVPSPINRNMWRGCFRVRVNTPSG